MELGITTRNESQATITDIYRNLEQRMDGRHLLVPSIGDMHGSEIYIHPEDSKVLNLLNNETFDVDAYPLSLASGTYFTEVLGPLNPRAQEYKTLIEESLGKVLTYYSDGAIPFEKLGELGVDIQNIDSKFAEPRVQSEPDEIHRCYGPDLSHPYAKITLFRTTIEVRIENEVRKLFIEKFLVSYSYLDQNKRKSTITPVHAHPPNVEIGYFVKYGPGSKGIEHQFTPMYNGELLLNGNTLNPKALSDSDILSRIKLKDGIVSEILPSAKPFLFPDSPLDAVALQNPQAFLGLSGLLRPHQVTIIDDPKVGTSFFSIITYFSLKGQVVVFNEDRTPQTKKWSHEEWMGNEK